MQLKKITVESESWSSVNFNLHFQPNIWVCPYLTQIWVVTTQHCLECSVLLLFFLSFDHPDAYNQSNWIDLCESHNLDAGRLLGCRFTGRKSQ